MTEQRPQRPWYQVSLGQLLLLVLVVCIPLSCIRVCIHQISEFERAVAPFERLNGWEIHASGDGASAILGARAIQVLQLTNPNITDADLRRVQDDLEALPNLTALSLSGTQVTDAGLVCLEGMNDLRHLYLENAKVTEEGVERLKHALPNCTIVH